MRFRTFGSWFLTILIAITVVGCASQPIDERDPNEVLKLAEGDIESSRYTLAIEKLRIVKNKHPYSAEARTAQLRLGDVYFMQESYLEAALTYEAFRDLYPKHERVAYATFRIGKSYFMDIPDKIARDLNSALKAERAYRDYLDRFPNAADSEEARRDLADTRNRLATKELYVAKWYMGQDYYSASEGRIKGLLKNYSDTPTSSEAETLLTQVADKAEAERSAQEAERLREEQNRLQRMRDET